MSTYYEVLEVPKTATKDEIHKAYKKLAFKWHPDKNLNNKDQAEEMFKKIGEAHEILTNDEKRDIYDRFGEEGLKNGGGGNPFEGSGFNPFDLFNNMFGGGGMPRNPHQNEETKNINVVLNCSLKDTYVGGRKVQNIERFILCTSCDATGFKDKQNHTCSTCSGKGVQIMLHQIGPGMVQQSTRSCSSCRGTGGDTNQPKCDQCHGKKRIKEGLRLEIDIKKGIKKGNQMLLRNHGNQIGPNHYSDIVIHFNVENDPVFTRKSNDLHRKVEISLRKALLGFEMLLDHLDGKSIVIKSEDIIHPFGTKMIPKLGFVDLEHGTIGDYYIEFQVIFPEKLSSKQLKALDIVFTKECLDDVQRIDNSLHYKLENIPGSNGKRFYKGLDDESEQEDGRQNIQCAQQ